MMKDLEKNEKPGILEKKHSDLIKVISGEEIKVVEAPKYGSVTLTFHGGNLKEVEEIKKTRFN